MNLTFRATPDTSDNTTFIVCTMDGKVLSSMITKRFDRLYLINGVNGSRAVRNAGKIVVALAANWIAQADGSLVSSDNARSVTATRMHEWFQARGYAQHGVVTMGDRTFMGFAYGSVNVNAVGKELGFTHT